MPFVDKRSMGRFPRQITYVAAAVAVLGLTSAASADEVFKATSAITVQGNALASFDISFVDPELGFYFLSDRSNAAIDAVPTNTNAAGKLGAGAFVGLQPGTDTSGPNGVITANDHREVWAGDGPALTGTKTSHVVVIDFATNNVIQRIDTGGTKRADELCEDPKNRVVMIANDDPADLFVTFISTKTYAVLGKISFKGGDPNAGGIIATNGIEQCQWSKSTGKIYLNIPENNGPGNDSKPGAVAVIDVKKMKVVDVFNVDGSKCLGNQGMSLGPDDQILLGCSNAGPGSVIISAKTGNTIFNLPGLNGNDETWYNPDDNQYFLAGSNATGGPIMGVVDAASGQEDQSVTTASGSHSVAVDPLQTQVYLPVNNTAAAQAAKLCSSVGGNDGLGCVLVLLPLGRDDPPAYVRRGKDDDFVD
jgi:hypothetical protein